MQQYDDISETLLNGVIHQNSKTQNKLQQYCYITQHLSNAHHESFGCNTYREVFQIVMENFDQGSLKIDSCYVPGA
jgi:hypothetical protein